MISGDIGMAAVRCNSRNIFSHRIAGTCCCRGGALPSRSVLPSRSRRKHSCWMTSSPSRRECAMREHRHRHPGPPGLQNRIASPRWGPISLFIVIAGHRGTSPGRNIASIAIAVPRRVRSTGYIAGTVCKALQCRSQGILGELYILSRCF